MIQPDVREKFRQNSSNKVLMDGVKNALVEGFKSKGAEESLKLVFEKNEDPEVKNILSKIGTAMTLIYKVIPRTIALPKIFNVKGTVKVENAITVSNQKFLEKKVDEVVTQIRLLAQAISSVPQQKIEFPRIDIPKAEKIDFTPVTEAVNELKNTLKDKPDTDSIPVLRKIQNAIEDLRDRPQMTPQPVTNVNINGLQGFAKTTAATVDTTLTPLPTYGQLNNRRSIIIFNNSSSTTIYVGGSDVDSNNGLPVLAQTYSPAIDAGVSMIVYAVTASGNADIRVMEVSSNQTASIVQ